MPCARKRLEHATARRRMPLPFAAASPTEGMPPLPLPLAPDAFEAAVAADAHTRMLLARPPLPLRDLVGRTRCLSYLPAVTTAVYVIGATHAAANKATTPLLGASLRQHIEPKRAVYASRYGRRRAAMPFARLQLRRAAALNVSVTASPIL